MSRYNEGSHSFTCHPHICPQASSRRASPFRLVLTSCPTEGRMLSWPGWLGEILKWFACRKTVIHPSICRGSQELNPQPSSRESCALTSGLPSHHGELWSYLSLPEKLAGLLVHVYNMCPLFERGDSCKIVRNIMEILWHVYVGL